VKPEKPPRRGKPDAAAEDGTPRESMVGGDPIQNLRAAGGRYFADVDPVAHQRELRDEGP